MDDRWKPFPGGVQTTKLLPPPDQEVYIDDDHDDVKGISQRHVRRARGIGASNCCLYFVLLIFTFWVGCYTLPPLIHHLTNGTKHFAWFSHSQTNPNSGINQDEPHIFWKVMSSRINIQNGMMHVQTQSASSDGDQSFSDVYTDVNNQPMQPDLSGYQRSPFLDSLIRAVFNPDTQEPDKEDPDKKSLLDGIRAEGFIPVSMVEGKPAPLKDYDHIDVDYANVDDPKESDLNNDMAVSFAEANNILDKLDKADYELPEDMNVQQNMPPPNQHLIKIDLSDLSKLFGIVTDDNKDPGTDANDPGTQKPEENVDDKDNADFNRQLGQYLALDKPDEQ